MYQLNSFLYYRMLKGRYYSPSILNAEDLINIKQIPASAYNPNFSIGFTAAPKMLPNGC